MIKTFANKETAALFQGLRVRTVPFDVLKRARGKLIMLDVVMAIDELRTPPGNRLEFLGGDRIGQWSIRVNRQWRICFRFESGNAFDVELVDYH
ncbi:MAG: type II toxin-antitoxin system RelE/ParE family toxin [Magnetococcales bacterium]|nr:type II toxin-antitoxin system RelE/ParE family toxin [Magnetococcales bacterium]